MSDFVDLFKRVQNHVDFLFGGEFRLYPLQSFDGGVEMEISYLTYRASFGLIILVVDGEGPKFLVHAQKGEQGQIRVLVPLDDPDPIFVIILLVVKRVEHED